MLITGSHDLPITVASATPSSGRCGDTVAIRGNFAVFSHQKLSVTFGGNPAEDVSPFNKTVIICTVPKGNGTVKLTVKGGSQSDSVDFTYL